MDKSATLVEIENEKNLLLLEAKTAMEKANALDVTLIFLRERWHINADVDKNEDLEKNEPKVSDDLENNAVNTQTNGFTVLNETVKILEDANRFLTRAEIVKIANQKLGINNFQDLLSSQLTIAANKKRRNVARKVVGNSKNNTVWGFLHWLNEDGTIQAEHIYDATALPYKVQLKTA